VEVSHAVERADRGSSERAGLAIRLLGKPRIERDGVPLAPPRGRKTWALLAYLLLCERPPPRSRVAGSLFSEADDPLGALRWTLADLRRTLGAPDVVHGDPLELRLGADVSVDITRALASTGDPGVALADGELLEGMTFPSSPVFDSWLGVMRRSVAGAARALAHDGAVARLAAGDLGAATELATDLVARDPLDQPAQELLIRCLARSGRQAEAERQLAECEALFGRELGIQPGPELRLAAREPSALPGSAVGDRDAALGQLEAGEAALEAGAVEPGIEILRQACAEAAAAGDVGLQARALATLGSALVHALRGRDEEGALRLHEALRLADASGQPRTAAIACRELGYIDTQAGRNPSAGRWLARATELAEGNDELCAVLGVRGMALSDRAHYAPALELLHKSVARADRCGRRRQAAWSLSLVGRIHVLRGDLSLAASTLDESLAIVAAERWTAFRPWPEALRAEVSLIGGHRAQAADALDRSFRLACRLGDPCWEAMSVRLAGLLALEAGDLGAARDRFADARARVTRVSDAYAWVHAHVLDSAAALAVRTQAPDARELVDRLTALAERCGMRELVVRAHVHRARLGDRASLEAASLLAADIDNPALAALVAPVAA
jgi:DNA-binding SARP family transcriptional activator